MSKWRTLLLLSLAELLGMSVWFSASAVVPALTNAWGLDESARAWLTMSVQLGFVAGTLASTLLNLPDRLPAHGLFSISSLLAGGATFSIAAFASGPGLALPLRFLSGLLLAGVYPVGMKIVATWTQEDRGLGIGLLVGALTLGSASPHLLNALSGVDNWRLALYLSSASAALGGIIALLFVREGPYVSPARRFNWRYAVEIVRQRDLMLANLGYLGHMWELFAMWSWVAIFLLGSFELSGLGATWASLGAFAVIAVGGLGSLLAGQLADRYGRTAVTIASMATSGLCALGVGLFYGGSPTVLMVICLVWGFAIVADSAQFSAAISELCQPEYTGTALTLQTSLGFLLTLATIRLVPVWERWLGWGWAFAPLALGPVVGIWAMAALRRSNAARRMASGKR